MSGEYSPEPQGKEAVKITPAMIEAGIEALWAHDLEHDRSREIVRDVFEAMRQAGGSTHGARWLRL